METPALQISSSCSFADQQQFARLLATQTANAKNNLASWRNKTYQAAQQSKVVPSFQDLYPGKLQLTFHHGRKYDQDDLKAQDARNEADRSKVLEIEERERFLHEIQYKGKSTAPPAQMGTEG